MDTITSRENAKIKEILLLQSQKKEREHTGLFVVEGAKLCLDAAKTTVIEQIFLTEQAAERNPQLLELCRNANEAFWITQGVLEKISDTVTPQGVFAVCKKIIPSPITPQKGKSYLFLSGIQDPGNMGAIIRTAQALGLAGIIATSDCADIYSPKVLRSTMGGVFHIPICTVDNIIDTIALFKIAQVPVYAAALTPKALRVEHVKLSSGAAILIGNEGQGLPQEQIEACTESVIIPMFADAQSLNAAIAAGIFMWEMTRHKRQS